MRIKQTLCVLLAMLLCVLIVPIQATAAAVAPTAVKLNPASVTLGVGETKTAAVVFTPSNATSTKSWKSSSTAIATVDSTGKIKAVKVGSATITMTTGNKRTATCKVTVKDAPKTVKLSATAATLSVGMTKTLSASYTPSTAAGKKTWASDNTKVATVDSSGKVTAKGVGTANITAVSYNKMKSPACKITVKAAPTSATLKAFKIGVGGTYTPPVTLAPAGTVATKTWKSSNTSVATVNATSGLVTAKKAGTTTLTVTTHNGRKASCTVTVVAVPSSITSIVTLYNNAANATKSAKNFSVTRVDKGDLKLDTTNMILRLGATVLLSAANKGTTTKEKFVNGKGTVDKAMTPNAFLPVINQSYMSKLKPEYVKSASCTAKGLGWTIKITLVPEKVKALSPAPKHATCMNTLNSFVNLLPSTVTVDPNSTAEYKGGQITAVLNGGGKLASVSMRQPGVITGRIKGSYAGISLKDYTSATITGSIDQNFTFAW